MPHKEPQNQESLSQSQWQRLKRRYELILQSAGVGIYGLDQRGYTTFVNRVAAEMIGWDLKDMVGKSQHAILHHSKEDGTPYDVKDCPIYMAINDGEVHHVDNEVFWRKDGSCFPVEYTSTPIKDEQGQILGAVVIFKDISERKASERAVEQANMELESALQEVNRLKRQLEQENKYLQQEIKSTHNFEEIISRSPKFKEILRQVEQVAPTDATVLIQGESGTGKELVARALHNFCKTRRERTLVKVNCAALPANLIESELFGHEKGAFTGAISRKIGRFELANDGTIFLDEIGEIPIELQPKLLRVLQEGEFERLGNPRTIKVRARVIAATNRDLELEIKKGAFREDLYYRLNVFPIQLPPLRERKEDIPLLVRHFIERFNKKFGRSVKLVSQRAMNELTYYSWPGNIRELENVIERAMIVSHGSKLDLGNSLPSKSRLAPKKEIPTLEELERAHILKTLKLTHWRVSGDQGAAKLLGLKRTTLEARMKKLGIQRPF